jgi:2-hydroxychromene-2-carboxylate isomerase
MMMSAPVFFLDFNSPYAYLAAMRVDQVLPVRPRWAPIALAFVLRARDRVPWSLAADTRTAGVRECEQRARRYGLPPLRWPPGWPRESYSLAPLRAALVAAEAGLVREFSIAAFERNFVSGTGLGGAEALASVARSVGLDADDVLAAIETPAIKESLRVETDKAISAGVVGVPTVAVGEELFWGDDRLLEAARAHPAER